MFELKYKISINYSNLLLAKEFTMQSEHFCDNDRSVRSLKLES